ncbi:hypothetical protein A9K75_08575 [Campylobacter fetus subsp. testudinum]|uniref:DUF3310 domain-containing protein n=1 Tax=Campylobacter fetus TaxID=196 RepID=UPI00081887C5|nr:DUF3310 domain-containing protein [Campylobacter fetus]OCR99056.1 hypothetical protein A9K75_08575 [Campylobacter fetus subsp. testudinum]
MDKALKYQVGGNHYQSMGMQPIELINLIDLNYNLGNVIKYIVRYPNKNGLEDLKKARHYIEFEKQYKTHKKSHPKKVSHIWEDFFNSNTSLNDFQLDTLAYIKIYAVMGREKGLDKALECISKFLSNPSSF